jgi:hypothetical protein
MNIERGARRIAFVLSCTALTVGVTVDGLRLFASPPRWVVSVALRDGRHTAMNLQWDRDALGDRQILADRVAEVLDVELAAERTRGSEFAYIPGAIVEYKDGRRVRPVELPHGGSIEFPAAMTADDIEATLRKTHPHIRQIYRRPGASDLVRVDVQRAWQWTDLMFTGLALGTTALVWIVFFAGRWVVQGFAET